MRRTCLCFLTVLLAGCPTRPRLQGGDGGDASTGPSDGDAGDLNRDVEDGGQSISIVSPASMTYANGLVLIKVQVSGATPKKVQLLRNDMAWQDLMPPNFE